MFNLGLQVDKSKSMKIRIAESKDVRDILEIYEPEVLKGYASMEEVLPSESEMWNRISIVLESSPWLVAEKDGKVVGYAYTAIHNGRIGYLYTRTLSVYIHPNFHNQGIAKALLNELFRILELQGYKKIISFIVIPNETSEILHRKYGFKKMGIFEDIAFKYGNWYSIIYYIKTLNVDPPGPIKDYRAFMNL